MNACIHEYWPIHATNEAVLGGQVWKNLSIGYLMILKIMPNFKVYDNVTVFFKEYSYDFIGQF